MPAHSVAPEKQQKSKQLSKRELEKFDKANQKKGKGAAGDHLISNHKNKDSNQH